MNLFQKTNTILGLLLGFIILGTTSCTEKDLGGFIPKDPNLTFGESDTIFVSRDAADYDVAIASNLPWRVKTDADWVTLNTQNGLSSANVTFSVAKNPTTKVRFAKLTAWITLEYQNVIIVKQEAGDPIPESTISYYVKATGNNEKDGLSWDNATTLDNALQKSSMGDKIYVAAGTYTPSTIITGGNDSDDGDKTFEIKNNISIIGGYPADASNGAIANGEVNKTILSGTLSAGNAYHVVTITAPIADNKSVKLNGVIIREGKASTLTTKVGINGADYPRIYGCGLIIAKSNVQFTDCSIINNESLAHAAGAYFFASSTVTFRNCKIENNIGSSATSNGGGIWNDASTITFYDSSISNNQTGGVGAGIYAYNGTTTSRTYVYNSTIANNKTGFTGVARAASGYYGRENSVGVMVNSTLYGNTADLDGGGISLYGAAKLDLISCTVTNNSSGKNGGGIKVNTGCTLSTYNSIISGNTAVGTGADIDGVYSKAYSIVSNAVFDLNGIEVASAIFDPATMLTPLANNGGKTYTCLLLGSSNPATSLGMTSTQLMNKGIEYDPAISEATTTSDQLGNSRVGKTIIGACIKQ